MATDPIEAVSRRERIGVAAVFLLAFFAWSSTTGAAIALTILFVAFALQRDAWRALRESALFWPLTGLVLYLALRSVWAAWELPETAPLQLRQLGAWFRLSLFVCIAWSLAGSLRRINWMLALALAGLLVGMVLDVDWQRLGAVLAGEDRHGINRHPNPFALYVGTALLGLLLFAPRILGPTDQRLRFAVHLILWLAAIAVLLEWLVITRTRSAWLGVAIVFPVVFAVQLIVSARREPRQLRRRLGILGLALAIIVVALAVNRGTIAARIAFERESISAIAEGRTVNLPKTSVVYRIHAYRFGLEKWLERPLLGWGPGSMRHVIDNSGRPELKMPGQKGLEWIDHLHNTYLELLVRFGLIGAALALAVVVILLRQTYAACRAGRLPLEHALFVFGAFGLMAVWNTFDFRLDHFDMRHYWLLLAGTAAAFALRRGRAGV